jgi:hypothetical protein
MYDIALEVADCAVNTQEPAGIISCRYGRLNREFSGPLVCLMEAYVATWMPKYGDLARRSLNWFLRTQQEVGIFPISVFTRGDMGDEAVIELANQPLYHAGTVYPIYYEALKHFDSPLLRETILAEADHVIASGKTGHMTTICALAYDITRDPIYAAMCKKVVLDYREHALGIVELRSIALFSGLRNGYISVLKATVAMAMEQDAEGLAEAEEKLKTSIGPPLLIEKPPIVEKNLGIPEGYDEV